MRAPALELTKRRPLSAEPTPVDLLVFPWTDSGNAERLIAMHGGSLRFVRAWSLWMASSGTRWAADDGAPFRAAKATAREMQRQALAIEDPDRRTAAMKFALAMESSKWIGNAVSLARHDQAVAVDHDAFNRDPMLLNVSNGTVDLRTGQLRPHDPRDLISKLAPVTYDAKATCPRFERFIAEIMGGDAELVAFLQRFLGYCLTGDVREHVLAFWHGPGGNGKGVLGALLMHIMGDYAGKAAPDLLFKSEHSDRHPTELADLFGLRLAICNETTGGRAWDEATVKDSTGGDRIKARRMRENFWEFDPTHKLVIWGNHKPRIVSVDDAMRRRLRLVPFGVSFVGREDRGLQRELEAEAPGVLRWLVEGCLAWQAKGLPKAAAVDVATRDYLRDEDTLGLFLDGECVFEVDARAPRKTIRDRFLKWSEERDERPAGPKVLAEALRRRGATEGNVRDELGATRLGWRGVRLATSTERAGREIAKEGRGQEEPCGQEKGQIPDERDRVRNAPVTRETVTTRSHVTTGTTETFGEYLEREGIGGVH